MRRMHWGLGSAAVALALSAAPSYAQSNFNVIIGGDANFQAGYVDQDRDSGLRSTEFRNRFRVNIVPTAKADNGLEYGGRVRIRAASNSGTMEADRAYVFAQGSFGSVRAGVHNSVNDDVYITAPVTFMDASQFGDANPAVAWIQSSNLRTSGADVGGGFGFGNHTLVQNGTATKVVYYTPRFSGLQGGVSYTPRTDSSNMDVNRQDRGSYSAGTLWTNNFQDVVEFNLNYRGNLGPVSLAVGAGYMTGDATENATTGSTGVGGQTVGFSSDYKRLNAWQLGGRVGYAGLEVGGGILSYGKSGQSKGAAVLNSTGFAVNQGVAGATSPMNREDAFSWTAGAQYTQGPLVVGVNYQRDTDAGSLALPGSRRLDLYSVGARYQVAPGLGVGLVYTYFDSKSDLTAAARAAGSSADFDDKGSVVLLHTTLAF